jgi:predicted  nucleic acid-binding Zn-ribbon protein
MLLRTENIRKEYLKLTQEIQEFEKIASELYHTLQTAYESVSGLSDTLNNDLEGSEAKLYELVLGLEGKMNLVNGRITSVEEKMDRLRKDEQELFRDMKEKYPGMSHEDMKGVINDHLRKKNLL